jgi:glycosyltransferase involved in cell wall biosynthesis
MKDIRSIALLGNMNNNNNALTRYLRDRHYNAKLFLFEHELEHFLPQSDQYDNSYTAYTDHLSWGSYPSLFFTKASTIKATLQSFDYTIGARLAPAYFARIGHKLDLFIPTGGDLCSLPFFNGFSPKRLLQFGLVGGLQRRGIAQAGCMLWDATNAAVEDRIQKLSLPKDRIRAGIPALYLPDYDPAVLTRHQSQSTYYDRFKTIREKHRYMVFHHIRHVWKQPSIDALGQFHAKSNDALVHGFAKFRQAQPQANSCLVLFDYGPDVQASKELCLQLGIADCVYWLPLMPRKELMYGLAMSDVMVGELKNSWLSYGSIFEAMAVKVPIIHHRTDSLYTHQKELYPMFDAFSADSVFESLRALYLDKAMGKRIGEQAYDWFSREVINKPLDSICERIDQKFAAASRRA